MCLCATPITVLDRLQCDRDARFLPRAFRFPVASNSLFPEALFSYADDSNDFTCDMVLSERIRSVNDHVIREMLAIVTSVGISALLEQGVYIYFRYKYIVQINEIGI